MKFYHGTSEECWNAIQDEGILFGRRYVCDNDGNIIKEVCRCTYLALRREDAEAYGDVLLEVEYEPLGKDGRVRRDKHGPLNNYCPDGWQLRVYEAIPLENVRRWSGESLKCT